MVERRRPNQNHSHLEMYSSTAFPDYFYYPTGNENFAPMECKPQLYQNMEHGQHQMPQLDQNQIQNQMPDQNMDMNMMNQFPQNFNAPLENFANPGQFGAQDFTNFSQFYGEQPTEHLFPPTNAAPFDHFPSATPSPSTGPVKKTRVKKVSTMHLNTSCSNCGTRDTKLWRRNENGMPECNPCNLYERVNGRKRPESLWNKTTLRRKRRPMAPVNAQQ